MSAPAERDARPFLIGAGLALALLGATVFAPFLSALLAAASVALLLAPLHKAWAPRAPGGPTVAAASLTGLVTLLMAVPFLLGGWALLREAAEAYPAAKAWLGGLDLPDSLDPRAAILTNLDQVSSWAGSSAKTLVRNAVFVFVNLAVFVASLFLFLRDGSRMIGSATELIPLPEKTKARLLGRVREVLLAVVYGLFAVALMQGALAWAGLALFRIPFAILLGAFCVVLSPIPFVGSALVWVPVVAYVFLAGSPGRAAGLAVWFMVVVGLSDNILRPILLGSQTRLPIPLVFIGVIGALKAFGFAGLFIGPLLIALAIGYFEILREQNAS